MQAARPKYLLMNRQPSIVKAQLDRIHSRKPSLAVEPHTTDQAKDNLDLAGAESGLAHVYGGQQKGEFSRPALTADIKNAGKLLQHLSTRLEAAGFSSRPDSRRPSVMQQA